MNKTITVNIPHRLSQEEARKRLESGITDLKTKYPGAVGSLQESWTANHLEFRVTAAGQAVSGRLDVLPESVKLEADLPWLIAAFVDKLRPKIEQEGRKLLE